MKSVIFAAGKGTRMGEFTRDIPKPLIEIKGKPILDYVLNSLPDDTDEIIIVTGYLEERIKKHFGGSFKGRPIKYVAQNKDMSGTGGALWSAKEFILNDKFLALNGDDIYAPAFLNEMAEKPLAFGVAEREWDGYLSVLVDENGNVRGMKQKEGKKLVSVGAYTLDGRIFGRKPFLIRNGEYSLPRTVIDMAGKTPVKTVFTDNWLPINTPEDIIRAEKLVPDLLWKRGS